MEFLGTNFFASLIAAGIGFGIYALGKRIVDKSIKKIDTAKNVRKSAQLIETGATVLYFTILVVVVLQINGINVDSLLTGLGVTGIVVGFALQDMLKDWVMGISIMSNDFFLVGDTVKIGDFVGRVEKLTLKSTKLTDDLTGSTVTINNREITAVEVLPNWLDISLPLSYDLTTEQIHEFSENTAELLRADERLEKVESKGISEFGDSCITGIIRLYVKDMPERFQVRRDALSVVRKNFEKYGYEIPYNKLDVNIMPAVSEKQPVR